MIVFWHFFLKYSACFFNLKTLCFFAPILSSFALNLFRGVIALNLRCFQPLIDYWILHCGEIVTKFWLSHGFIITFKIHFQIHSPVCWTAYSFSKFFLSFHCFLNNSLVWIKIFVRYLDKLLDFGDLFSRFIFIDEKWFFHVLLRKIVFPIVFILYSTNLLLIKHRVSSLSLFGHKRQTQRDPLLKYFMFFFFPHAQRLSWANRKVAYDVRVSTVAD